MADNAPEINPFTGKPYALQVSDLPKPSFKGAEREGVFGRGIQTGFNETQSILGSAVAAAGKLYGLPGVEAYGTQVAQKNAVEAQASSNPAYEGMPWTAEGPTLAQTPAWVAYQASKQLSQLGLAYAAGRLIPKGAIPAELARVGAAAPRSLGGAGLAAGASFAERRLALEAGNQFARTLVGAEVSGIPQAVGSMYQQAAAKPGGATQEDAAKAFAFAPAYAALDAVQPAQLEGLLKRGLAGNLAKRVFTASAVGGISEMPQEAAQTAMELSFRPDMSPADKMKEIVNAALVGGAVGAAFGGLGGIRKLKTQTPDRVDNDTLSSTIDEALTGQTTANPPQSKESLRDSILAGFEQSGGDVGVAATALQDAEESKLRRLMAEANVDIKQGRNVEQSQLVLAAVEDEMQRRALTAQQAAPAATTAEPVETPAAVPQDFRQIEGADATKALAIELSGRTKPDQFISKLTAQNPVELLNEVVTKLEKGSTSQTALNIVQSFGLMDAQGQPRDLDAEVNSAYQEMQAAEEAARNDPAMGEAAMAAQQKLNDLTSKLEVVNAFKALRGETQENVDAVQESGTEGMDVRQPAQIGAGVAEGNTQGVQAPAQGQTQAQREFEKFQLGIKAQLDKYRGESAATQEPTPTYEIKAVGQPVARQKGAPGYIPVRLNDGSEVQIYSKTQQVAGTGKAAGKKVPRTTWYVRDPEYAGEDRNILTVMGSAEATKQQALREMRTAVNTQRADVYAQLGRTAEADLAEKPAEMQAILDRIALRDKPAELTAALEEARQAPVVGEAIPTREYAGEVVYRGAPRRVETSDPLVFQEKSRQRAETKAAIFQAIDDAYAAAQDGEPGITQIERMRLVKMAGDPKNYKDIQKYLRNKVKYSEGQAGTGIDPQNLAQAVAKITQGWKANRNVTVVGAFDELPVGLQFRMLANNAANARGVVTEQGDVYLLAHNLNSVEEGIATLYHENLGHIGLAGMFRKRLDAVLVQLYKQNSTLKAATDQWRANNRNAYETDANPLARAVEEILAQESEAGQIEASVFAKLKAFFKLMAQRIGWRIDMSDGDIRAILAMAHNRAILGKFSERAVRGVRYMFAGENALLADRHQLSKAIAMDKLGASARPGGEIQQQTGWFKGFDNMWRFELSDKGAGMTPAWTNMQPSMDIGLPLSEVFDHPTFYEQYPAARDIMVYKLRNLQTLFAGLKGAFDEESNKLYIADNTDNPVSVVLHELQHWVQGIENLARGGDANTALNKASLLQLERMRDDLASDLSPRIARLLARINLMERVQNNPVSKEYERVAKKVAQLFSQRGNTDLWENGLRTEWNNAYREQSQLRAQLLQSLAGVSKFLDLPVDMQEEVAHVLSRLDEGKLSEAIGTARANRHELAEKLKPIMRPKTEAELRKFLADSGAGTKAYRRLAGEIEARETQQRMDWDDTQRQQEAAYAQLNIAPEDIIVDFEGGGDLRFSMATPAQLNQRMEGVQKYATSIFDAVDRRKSLTSGLRKQLLGWSSVTHMLSRFGKLFQMGSENGLQSYVNAENERAAINARLSQLYTNLEIKFEQLTARSPKTAEKIGTLMSTTEFEIDPRKSWDDHQWLHGKPNEAHLKKLVADANAMYRDLKREGADGIYNDFVATNEAMHFAMMSVSLHNLVTADPTIRADEVPEFDMNPMDQFREQSALHEEPVNARDYWRDILDVQVAAVKRYIEIENELANDPNLSDKKRNEINDKMKPLKRRLESIDQSIAAMNQSPYFHLGRFGDYFVAFSVKKNAEGKPDAEALNVVAKALEKVGIDHVRISEGTEKRNVFMRFDSLEQQADAEKVVRALMAKGLIDTDGSAAPKAGSVRNEDDITQLDQPMWLDRYIQTLQASDAFDADVKAKMVANAREVWLDMLPDTALNKVMVHREAVPGYNADMIRNYAHRMRVGATAVSNLSTASKITLAFTQMRQAVQDAKKLSSPKHSEANTIQQVFSEISQRVTDRADKVDSPIIDRLVAVNHAYFLGMSPSYVLVNLTQVGALLWPELTKQKGVGFVDAAKTIAKVTPIAFKIMKATFNQGKALGWKRAADAIITQEALVKSGVSEETAKYIMDMVNTGTIDIGNASRELGRAAEGRKEDKVDLALRYASAAGYYSETFTRLIAALAARENYKGPAAGLKAYANNVVTQSMLNYATWNRARQTNKNGIFGPMSPVVMAFMTYQFQVIEKMYREMYTAFSANATADEKKAARKFLGAHATAMIVLAGSLGLPMASVVARAVEALKDLFDDDDEPYNAKAAWYNFLTDIFGTEAGKMLAKGILPRALGIDLTQRVGEADIIPFSKLLTDRRKWEDATKDYLNNSAGAPFSMVSNIVASGGDMMDGDGIGGMQKLVPVAFKGPIASWRMGADGRYVDAKGNPMPISSPGADDILKQALGFVPAEKADAQEEKMMQTVRKGQIMQQASNIRKRFVNAIESGDRAEQRKWLKEMQNFDRQFPAYAIMPNIDSVLRQRQKKQMQVRQAGVPIGANPKDMAARDLTRWNSND